jgi:hypothetical protein
MNGSKIADDDRVSETNALGGARSLLRRCGQNFPSIPYRPPDGLLLASA